MQTDYRISSANTSAMRQQLHRKRSFSGTTTRKRDRHDLICVVCHAPAMGYNFDQITCESCKAFFRRNALNNTNKFKCRSGTGDCVVNMETRKRCKFCRLKKCFDKGLRKEWIMSEEEKRTKKQKIEDNRRLRAMTQNHQSQYCTPLNSPFDMQEDDSFHNSNDRDSKDRDVDMFESLFQNEYSLDYKHLLSSDDQVLLTKISQNYSRAVALTTSVVSGCKASGLRHLNDVPEIVNGPGQMSTMRLITFLKLTSEFNLLHEDDRLALVKYNLIPILYLHTCICLNVKTEIYQEPNTSCDFCYQAKDLYHYSHEIYYETIELVKEIQNLCSNDHLIIKLLILIMIFSKGSDMGISVWTEPQRIFHAQNIFINLLWRYLDVRFGNKQVSLIYSHLIFLFMKIQEMARKTKSVLLQQLVSNDELAPLMQAILFN